MENKILYSKGVKTFFLIFQIFLIAGCAMTIRENPDGSCTLKGFGSGKGDLNKKCNIEKSLITIPSLDFRR